MLNKKSAVLLEQTVSPRKELEPIETVPPNPWQIVSYSPIQEVVSIDCGSIPWALVLSPASDGEEISVTVLVQESA